MLITLAVTCGESVADDVDPLGLGANGVLAPTLSPAALVLALAVSLTRGVPAPRRWSELELALLETASPAAAALLRASCRSSPSSSSELIDALSSIERSESSGGGAVGGGGVAGGAGGGSVDIELLVDASGARAL